MECSLYIHVPFCSSKCDYCDFYSIPLASIPASGIEPMLNRYIDRALADAGSAMDCFRPEYVPTVYIGGGTPSALGAGRIRRLLNGLRPLLPLEKAPVEITVEVNPETADEDLLYACLDCGVNRISMGIQTFHEPSRSAVHRSGMLSAALEERLGLVSRIFPENFSVDLISGLPLQTEEILFNDIERVLAFNPGHISLYALTLEEGTVLERRLLHKHGRGSAAAPAMPGADEADALWLSGRGRIISAGYEQYEVSNFSLNGKRSLHNIRYWRLQNWLGIGPGASSTIFDENNGSASRRTIPAGLETWLAGNCGEEEFIDTRTLMKETLLMGFRYVEGPDPERFRARFGISIEETVPQTLKQWRGIGLMAENRIALNPDGLLLLNRFLIDAFGEVDGLRDGQTQR